MLALEKKGGGHKPGSVGGLQSLDKVGGTFSTRDPRKEYSLTDLMILAQ